MEGTSFAKLPEELKEKILLRMSLNSLVKCMCVSKKLALMISTKSFRELYLCRSMTRPRVLFATNDKDIVAPDVEGHVLFRSFYQEEEPLLSSGQQRIIIPQEGTYKFSPPVLGLICLLEENGTNVMICNPGTKKLVTLPRVQEEDRITTHFGYDEREDVFKVLCITTSQNCPWLPTYQVLTVESGTEQSWREIRYKYPHIVTDIRHEIFKRGVMYYLADYNDEVVIMSFDLRFEDFQPIASPDGVVLTDHMWKFVNYNEEIALVYCFNGFVYEPNGDAYVEIWVWNSYPYSPKWLKNRILQIHNWREYSQDKRNDNFLGTTGTGELNGQVAG